ncbi:hypothetical protein BDF22DRAFT_653350 [Syncephalis plumigaleata]|nr:hypothetical protein BDF22DRAFT_653350 [Syncephalis plumigaleata]
MKMLLMLLMLMLLLLLLLLPLHIFKSGGSSTYTSTTVTTMGGYEFAMSIHLTIKVSPYIAANGTTYHTARSTGPEDDRDSDTCSFNGGRFIGNGGRRRVTGENTGGEAEFDEHDDGTANGPAQEADDCPVGNRTAVVVMYYKVCSSANE